MTKSPDVQPEHWRSSWRPDVKLYFCSQCEDMVGLSLELTQCTCGHTWGKYLEDGKTVEVSANTVIVAFDQMELRRAIQQHWQDKQMGSVVLYAYILDHHAKTVRRLPNVLPDDGTANAS